MGAYGMSQGSKATKAANAANLAQQAAALKFQRQMQKKQLAEIADMQKGATEKILASSKRTRSNVLEKLAQRGWDPGGGVGLSAMRSGARDETNALSNLASQMAAQRQSVYTGQEFPMIQHTGGQATSAAGMQMMGAGLGMAAQHFSGLDQIAAMKAGGDKIPSSHKPTEPWATYGWNQTPTYATHGFPYATKP
jgi:hypothetical protein